LKRDAEAERLQDFARMVSAIIDQRIKLASIQRWPIDKEGAHYSRNAFASRNAKASACRKLRKAIEQATDDLKSAAKNDGSDGRYVRHLRLSTVGDIGKISTIFRVLQVIDEKNTIVKYEAYNIHGERDYARDSSYWVDGQLGQSFADGDKVHLDGIWEVSGTKTYTTAIGSSNTIYVLSPVAIKLSEVTIPPLPGVRVKELIKLSKKKIRPKMSSSKPTSHSSRPGARSRKGHRR